MYVPRHHLLRRRTWPSRIPFVGNTRRVSLFVPVTFVRTQGLWRRRKVTYLEIPSLKRTKTSRRWRNTDFLCPSVDDNNGFVENKSVHNYTIAFEKVFTFSTCPPRGDSIFIFALLRSVLGVAVITAILTFDGIMAHSFATLNPVYKLSPENEINCICR